MYIAGLLDSKNVAVLIHGCHTQAINFDELVIGNLPEKAGRAPRGIEVALELEAELIIWGTGASERDGKKEARVIFDLAHAHLKEIVAYLNTHATSSTPSKFDESFLDDFLKKVSVLDTTTQNTTEEVEYAARLCLEKGKTVLIQVSSPTHIARCYMEGLKWKEKNPDANLTFIPIASDTCFAGATATDVVILEPPHRGDRARVWLNQLVRPMLRLMNGTEDAARPVLEDVCKALEKHGINIDPKTLIR